MNPRFFISFLLFVLCFYSVPAYSQDSLKMQAINAIVDGINKGNFSVQQDSVIQSPIAGLEMKTYLTMVMDGKELKKFVNNVYTVSSKDDGTKEIMNGFQNFYFNNSKLIKVEEYSKKNDEEYTVDWYYADGKPLKWKINSANMKAPRDIPVEKLAERAGFLLQIAESILQQAQK